MKTPEMYEALELIAQMEVHEIISDIVSQHDESLDDAIQDLEYLRDEINRVLTHLGNLK